MTYTGLWFSLGTQVSSTNKTDHHDITEILLKVALTTINQPTILSETNAMYKFIYFGADLKSKIMQVQQDT
jgi:hypothetical protein